MSEDVLLHFTSNSSNQSDQSLPSKLAKLEARMAGKTSTAVTPTLQMSSVSSSAVSAKFGANIAGGICAESLDSTDSEEDDSNGREFLIQPNFQKRRKLADDADLTAAHQVVADVRQKDVEAVEGKSDSDVNRRKQTRGKSNSTSARGCGLLVDDQIRIQNSTSNGLLENSNQRVLFLCNQFQCSGENLSLVSTDVGSDGKQGADNPKLLVRNPNSLL